MRSSIFAFSLLGLSACGGGDGIPVLEPLEQAVTTADQTIVPAMARLAEADDRNPSMPENVTAMIAEGYGDYTIGAGESYTTVVSGGGAVPTAGAGAALVTRFAHLADLQLMDDESPARLAALDAPGLTSSASRAQDAYGCRMTAAMTRSLNAVHAETPLDFVLLGGDNTDNAQSNELDWVLTLLGSGGGEIHCDSGVDDDPVKGNNNDPKDPFVTPGLDVPFVWVMGNHDVLNQGVLVITEDQRGDVIDSDAFTGTRDFSMPGGPVVFGTVPADPARAYLTSTELLTRISQHGDGHGITAATAASGRATFAYDVPDSNIRIIVIDTTSPFGSAEGLIREGDVTNTLIPLFDAAQADGKWVFLSSHHASSSLTNGGQTGGTPQPDAITEADFVDLITSYPNIVASFVGHTHRHRVRPLIGNGRSVWEIMTAAVMDFPHQSRIVEVHDEDNGFLRIRLTSVDFATDDDPVAEEARAYGLVDFIAGWADDSTSEATDRNIDLYIPAPSL